MIRPEIVTDAIAQVINREGGYVNHPADRGGPTKFGITEKVAREHGITKPIADLTRDEAERIYRQTYVSHPRLDLVNDPRLFNLLFDSAVNHGQRTAVQWLQRALDVPADGVIGAQTLTALELQPVSKTYKRVLRHRLVRYAQIVESNPTQGVFIEGWIGRGCEFLDALELPP